MSLTGIKSLLENKIGLSDATIGSEAITKVIKLRMTHCGCMDSKAYLTYLQTSDNEWEELIDLVVVPETWFYRNKDSFTFFEHYVKLEWLPSFGKKSTLRVLSIPCSSGEEPYSIAMSLMDVGLAKSHFYIDAVDISNKVLHKAKRGIYTEESFRGQIELSFRERYFEATTEGYKVHSSVKRTVNFIKGNLLDERLILSEKAYDIIFCRNLLIYWGEQAKRRGLNNLNRLLSKTGILFVGHAERPLVCDYGFEQIRQSGVFACRKAGYFHDSPSQGDKKPVFSNYFSSPPTKAEKLSSVVFSKAVNSKRFQAKELSDTLFSKTSASERSHVKMPRGNPVDISATDLKIQPDSLILKKETGEISTASKTMLNTPQGGTVFSKNLDSGHLTDSSLQKDHPSTPNRSENLFEAAKILADQGHLKKAFNLCEQYLSDNADSIPAHFLMGLICQALDFDRKAEEHFNKTVYLEPNHFEALNHLAFMMDQRGDRDKAMRLRRRLQRITNNEK